MLASEPKLNQTPIANRAAFHFWLEDQVLFIEDLLNPKSLTNDMKYVLNDIAAQLGNSLDTLLIIYKDSDGVWDGVVPSGKGSHQFYSLNERDIGKAKIKALQKTLSSTQS